MRPIVLVSVCVLGCGLSAAEQQPINDLRLGFAYGVAENPELEAVGDSSDTDADTLRFTLSYLRSVAPLGESAEFFVGGSVFHESSSGDARLSGKDADVDTDTLGLGIEGGCAYTIPSHEALRLEAALQLGYLSQGLGIDTGTAIELHQTGFECAVRVTGEYAITEQWLAGLDLRWLIFSRTTGEFDSEDINYNNDGLAIGLNVGYRL